MHSLPGCMTSGNRRLEAGNGALSAALSRTRKSASAVPMGTSSPNSRARFCLARVFPATTRTGATDCLSARGT